MRTLSKAQKKYLKVIIPIAVGLFAWAAIMPAPSLPPSTTSITTPPASLPLEGDMKPAWYQVFRIVPADATPSPQQTSPLHFAETTRQSPTLRVFRLYNNAPQEIQLPTQDGSLIMIQEALSPQGKWQAIEYWNYDWGLGANFGQISLPAAHFVSFTAPDYGGDFKTKIRFRLKITDKETILSQEFSGTVPVSQFVLSAKDKQKHQISYLH